MKSKRVVRNEVEDGSTERRVKYLTLLAEPQGKIKRVEGDSNTKSVKVQTPSFIRKVKLKNRKEN